MWSEWEWAHPLSAWPLTLATPLHWPQAGRGLPVQLSQLMRWRNEEAQSCSRRGCQCAKGCWFQIPPHPPHNPLSEWVEQIHLRTSLCVFWFCPGCAVLSHPMELQAGFSYIIFPTYYSKKLYLWFFRILNSSGHPFLKLCRHNLSRASCAFRPRLTAAALVCPQTILFPIPTLHYECGAGLFLLRVQVPWKKKKMFLAHLVAGNGRWVHKFKCLQAGWWNLTKG